jgi:hypothetical protein
MRWFKHDSDASNDAKLRKLRHKYGVTGYGVYWYCLELIARNVDKHNLTFALEHDAELIADDFKLSAELVEEMMMYMVRLDLFENAHGIITCLKMSTRTDEYTQKVINKSGHSPVNVPTITGQNPEKSELREEKRREENITADDFALFWESYPCKLNKQPALKAWNRLSEKEKKEANSHLVRFIDSLPDFQKPLRLHASTYLNNKRWNDESAVPDNVSQFVGYR